MTRGTGARQFAAEEESEERYSYNNGDDHHGRSSASGELVGTREYELHVHYNAKLFGN